MGILAPPSRYHWKADWLSLAGSCSSLAWWVSADSAHRGGPRSWCSVESPPDAMSPPAHIRPAGGSGTWALGGHSTPTGSRSSVSTGWVVGARPLRRREASPSRRSPPATRPRRSSPGASGPGSDPSMPWSGRPTAAWSHWRWRSGSHAGPVGSSWSVPPPEATRWPSACVTCSGGSCGSASRADTKPSVWRWRAASRSPLTGPRANFAAAFRTLPAWPVWAWNRTSSATASSSRRHGPPSSSSACRNRWTSTPWIPPPSRYRRSSPASARTRWCPHGSSVSCTATGAARRVSHWPSPAMATTPFSRNLSSSPA